MENKTYLTILLFIININICVSQSDTTKVHSIELNLPIFNNKLDPIKKYGVNKSNWPVWLNNVKSNIDLDQIRLNKIYYNKRIISFDKAKMFKEIERIPNIKTVIQGDLKFRKSKDKYEFQSLDKEVGKESIRLYYQINNTTFVLLDLELIKKYFPKSFQWRDYFPNQLGANFSNSDLINITIVSFINEISNNIIEIYFYKNNPVYILQNIKLEKY